MTKCALSVCTKTLAAKPIIVPFRAMITNKYVKLHYQINSYLNFFLGCNLLKAINVTAADKEYQVNV